MEFDKDNLVLVETMNREEARAFVLFLASEILRHRDDITKARLLASGVCRKFNLESVDVLGVIEGE